MNLQEFFKENPKVALAFSGGVDSSYLLYAAMKYGADVKAYYVKALFQPQFEMDDAMRLAEQLKAPVRVLRADVLSDPVVVSNPSNRCYYCKKVIFNMIMKAAAEDGYTVLLDGTNASDDAGDRPGMKALQELQVKSPLRECGLVKSEIRRLSKEGGLFTWDKPSYACLATRIPTGCEITAEKLQKTEAAENFLFSLGFSDFRVRMMPNGAARLQVLSSQLPLLKDSQWDAEKQYKVASNVYPNEASEHIERVLGNVAFQIPHSEEVKAQALEGNLLKELVLKDSKGFRKTMEAITKEVFGC